jgi:hypothetical protein
VAKRKLRRADVEKKQTRHERDIESKLIGCSRKEAQDIIYVGLLVERTLRGEFGAVLKALTAGRIASELSDRTSTVASERRVGRLEMANQLWEDLEEYVHDKDRMQASIIKEDMPVETYNYTPM